MLQLFSRPPLTAQFIIQLDIPNTQKQSLNEIIQQNDVLSFILNQQIWIFYEFDKKYGRISFAGKYSNYEPKISCLQEMNLVFDKVKHYPSVKQIIIFRQNMRVLKSPLFQMQYENLKQLNLQLNKTLTMQPLSWLNAHNLQKLSISQNYMTNIKFLTKCNWKLLSRINICNSIVQKLSQNPLNSGNSIYLPRTRFFGAGKLIFDSQLILKQEQKSYYFDDLSFLFKTQFDQLDPQKCVSKEDFNKDHSINANKHFNCLIKRFGQDLSILEIKINKNIEA